MSVRTIEVSGKTYCSCVDVAKAIGVKPRPQLYDRWKRSAEIISQDIRANDSLFVKSYWVLRADILKLYPELAIHMV